MGLLSKNSALGRFLNRKSVKYGLPFFILMIGGSFGLREFTNLRYQFRQVSPVSYREVKKMGIDMKKPSDVTLEGEYEKMQQLDLDDWQPVRIPRPWDENDES